MSELLNFDKQILELVNQQWASPLMDQFFIFLTNAHKIHWVRWQLLPAILLLAFAWKRQEFLKALLVCVICVSVSDLVAYRLVKPMVARPRPNQSGSVESVLREGKPAHGFSFPSNHAANSFAGAAALSFYFPGGAMFFMGYTLLVAYSRPYLGVHYPLDVVGGGLLGLLVSWLLWKLVLSRWQWLQPKRRNLL